MKFTKNKTEWNKSQQQLYWLKFQMKIMNKAINYLLPQTKYQPRINGLSFNLITNSKYISLNNERTLKQLKMPPADVVCNLQ